MTNFRTQQSPLDLAVSGHSISNESQTVPVSSPYSVRLNETPQVNASATSCWENSWVSVAEATTLITITVGGAGRTITTNQSPSSGEVYLQICEDDFPISTKLVFHSSDAGGAVLATYTGFGSNNDTPPVTALQEAVGRCEAFPYLRMVSSNTYSAGYFDNTVENDKNVYLLPSGYQVSFSSGRYEWSGGFLDFDASGNCEVAAFSNATYWKRIGIWLYVNGGVLTPTTMESAEAATQGALTDPTDYSSEGIFCGYIDVENDGNTGVAGAIEVIPNDDIDSQIVAGFSSTMQAQPIFEFTWEIDGSLVAGTDVAGPWFPGFAGTIQSLSVICTDTGSGGDNLVVDCNISGTSIYSVSGTQPTITANSGTYQTDTSTDMGTTTFSNSEYLTIDLDTVPTASETVKITIRGVRT